MTDLTPYLRSDEKRKICRLFLSDAATAELGKLLRAHHGTLKSAPEFFAPIVAQSVASFLTSGYFELSTWFEWQRVHTVCACLIHCEAGPVVPIFHLVRLGHCGFSVELPADAPLAPGYFEQRVIEEVRMESGAADGADEWRRRTQ